jgi:tRNA(His) 5'-end guanylyltransferase
MDEGALAICAEMMGCRFAYGQSDEYSFLATDFETYQSEPWFGGNIQKIASVSASIFTAAFNSARFKQQNNQGKQTDWASRSSIRGICLTIQVPSLWLLPLRRGTDSV